MDYTSCPNQADSSPQNSEINNLNASLGVTSTAGNGRDGDVKGVESATPPTLPDNDVAAPSASTDYTAWDDHQAQKIGRLTRSNGSTVFAVGQLVDEWIRHDVEALERGGGEMYACNDVIPRIVQHPEVSHCTRQWLYKCWNAHRFVAAYGDILGQFDLKPSALIQLARLDKATQLPGEEHKKLIRHACREVSEQGLTADAVRRWVSATLQVKNNERPKKLSRLPVEPPKGLLTAAKITTDLAELVNPRVRVAVVDVAAGLLSYLAAARAAVKGMAGKIVDGDDPELARNWSGKLREWSVETAELAEALIAKFNAAQFACTKCGHACVGSDLTNQALWKCHGDAGGCGKIFGGEQRADCHRCGKSAGILKEADHACPKCTDGYMLSQPAVDSSPATGSPAPTIADEKAITFAPPSPTPDALIPSPSGAGDDGHGPEAKGLLTFTNNNAKLGREVQLFSIPAGHSCPGALECLSKCDPETLKLRDGPHTKFRCYSATQETTPQVSGSRWRNFNLLRQAKTATAMAELITRSIPVGATKVRIHGAGDFFSQDYFDAWLAVAKRHPEILFYAYTKSLRFWVARLDRIPKNLILTASMDGQFDHLIAAHNLRYTKVVYTPEEAAKLGLEIDHDDSHAQRTGPNFALLLHGVQPKGSPAAAALAELKRRGIQYSYSRKAAGHRDGKDGKTTPTPPLTPASPKIPDPKPEPNDSAGGAAIVPEVKSWLLGCSASDHNWKQNLKKANAATLQATLAEMSKNGSAGARKQMEARLRRLQRDAKTSSETPLSRDGSNAMANPKAVHPILPSPMTEAMSAFAVVQETNFAQSPQVTP